MLVIFAVIIGGIITGRLLSSWRLVFVSRMITVIIWLLLFLLGLEVGSDPAVVGGMATLGRTAFVIFACSVAGSICMSWLLWRCVRRRDAVPDGGGAESPGLPATAADFPRGAAGGQAAAGGDTRPLSVWDALRGSLVIVAFFVAGCLAGLFSALPFDVAGSRLSTYVLYALMFCVGITLGSDTALGGRVRRLDPRLALLPVMTAVGTLAGAALSTLLLPPLTAGDTMAVGAGFGYYSLSSIFIADFRGAELGTVALLCNVMRELFTLLAAPLVARWFGPLAAVSIGGATTFDTTLPIITQSAGKPYAVVSIFHGCVLDFSVPFLVTFFCTM
ncbi:lysine exporter LysO family protein [Alistipes onderdonkii]|uniref:lysine exporter LysO family protein n=1 Tax=Alistipes onderdonkii TaxID=328813 RepID=UPI0018970A87|nr:lysine exporter LysO family protein [Alistipes onderdonkii]